MIARGLIFNYLQEMGEAMWRIQPAINAYRAARMYTVVIGGGQKKNAEGKQQNGKAMPSPSKRNGYDSRFCGFS